MTRAKWAIFAGPCEWRDGPSCRWACADYIGGQVLCHERRCARLGVQRHPWVRRNSTIRMLALRGAIQADKTAGEEPGQ